MYPTGDGFGGRCIDINLPLYPRDSIALETRSARSNDRINANAKTDP